MLHSIKQLYGDRLGALDGSIGHVKDFYFDDRNWAVRYLIADTGNWLPGRQVLITPHTIGNAYQAGKFLPVSLTRKQIEDSPAIEEHKPVSRQYEEGYYRHYGWPNYWQGGDLWGANGFPILYSPAQIPSSKSAATNDLLPRLIEGHLRSTRAVSGYHLRASDGIAGHVCDFMMDDTSWIIGQLVIKIGHRLSGGEVQIPASKVDRISYEESTVFVSLTKAEVEQNPSHQLIPIGAVD